MENVYTVKFEIKMSVKGFTYQGWRDVTTDVIGTSTCKTGIDGTGTLDRVASTGTLSFTLLNTGNKYTPDHTSRTYNLTSGCAVRLSFAFEGRPAITKFYGFIPPEGIEIKITPQYNTIEVVAVDFVEHLANHELELPAYTTSKRIDEILPLILANMHVQPLSTSYGTGQSTFATVFDTVKSTTKALAEINKLALSELGYVYIKPTTSSDEVLTVEGRKDRNVKGYKNVYVWDQVVSLLLQESGDDILTESSISLSIENVYTATSPLFYEDIQSVEMSHADGYYNTVKTTVYPRRQGTPGEVLYNLERPVLISAGATVYVTGRFVDPNQEAQNVAGISMVTPAATTDCLFNSAEDGTGTNMTANLTVTATYGVNGVDYALTNTHGSTTGYVTKLQARGTGVYTYRQADRIESDTALVNAEGKRMLTLNMRYQDNPLVGTDFAVFLLDIRKEKLTTINSITVISNASKFAMNAFLDVGIGDKIHLLEPVTGIDRAFFLNNIEFSIQPGGLVIYKWELKDSIYETFDSWILGTSVLDSTTILGY